MVGMEFAAARVALPALEAPDRLTELYENHVDFVWRTARRFGLSAAEADDAAQRVFLVASKKLGVITREREKAFFFRATINVTRTMLRSTARKREKLREDSEGVDTHPSPEETLSHRQELESAHAILQAMPESLREAFILFELEEMTMLEVSCLLEIPAGTVASRIRRARGIFRAAVKAMEAP